MRLGALVDRVGPIAFVLGLGGILFVYGVLVGKHRLFPYRFIAPVEEAGRGFYEAKLRPIDFANQMRHHHRGARALDPARTAPGATFVVGFAPAGFEGRLVGADGRVLHVWHARFSEVWPQGAPHIVWQNEDLKIAWHGAHLFPNGDILLNFQDANFPYGGGLVKLDRDSKVVWKLERNTHHAVTLEPDGRIRVPSLRYRPDGVPGAGALLPGYYEDTLLEVAADGRVLDEISLLEALRSWPALFSLNHENDLDVASEDPTHLNDVEPLPAALAPRFPLFAAGDLLVSMRNINTIAVIDARTRRVRWSMTGPFVRQHDPDFLPNGNLLVFDNRGGDPACGGSRVLEIEPATQKIVWQYDGCGGTPFYSQVRGEQQLLPNGNLLILEATRGRVLEVTREAQPRIVWEYYNVIGETEEGVRTGIVTHASRHELATLTFLDSAVAQRPQER
jgi:hypothetical protein